MAELNHKQEEELQVLYDYLVEKFHDEIHSICKEIAGIVDEHKLCYHNLHTILSSLNQLFAHVTIYELPLEIAKTYTDEMLFEIAMNGIGDLINDVDPTNPASIFVSSHSDENPTGETKENTIQ